MTADTLGPFLGYRHPLLVQITSSLCEHWKLSSSAADDFLEQQKSVIDQINMESPTPSNIEVLCDFTASHLHIKPNETPQYAELLHRLALRHLRSGLANQGLRYDGVSRSLAYSVDLLARCQLDPVICDRKHDIPARDQAFQHVAQTIEMLRHGDLDCKVRAAHLSKRLSIWLKTFVPGRSVVGATHKLNRMKEKEQKRVTSMILAQVDEMPICRPVSLDPPWQGKNPRHDQRGEREPSQKNRWRRKVREREKMAAASILDSGGAGDVRSEKIKGPPAPRVDKTRKVKGPA
ncbi:hypothetical protein OQA88_5595 [Cercophora sp. LCS_1]